MIFIVLLLNKLLKLSVLGYSSVVDPVLEIRGEGGCHPDREIKWAGGGGCSVSKKFFWPFGPQFGLKMSGGWPPGPLLWIHHCSCVSVINY